MGIVKNENESLLMQEEGGTSLCNYSAFAMMFFGFASMAMVMTMSIERFLSIQHPFFYHRKVTAKKVTNR